ncbi:MAG: hypothetical protein HQK49_07880 [Oligoflexia bacterium]|nr:hypothetical protein [Oligoflexia bacterium]
MPSLNISAQDGIYILAIKKVEAKKSRGWNLAEWLFTKRKMELMDQWLALHSSFDFEFVLHGGANQYNLEKSSTVTNLDNTSDSDNNSNNYNSGTIKKNMIFGTLGVYYRLFGLEGGFVKSNEKYLSQYANLAIRIFGVAVQSSNITLHYGLQQISYDTPDITRDANSISASDSVNEKNTFTNQYWGGKTTIYLASFLGLEGLYRNYIKKKNGDQIEYSGTNIEYGAFLDLSFFRPSFAFFLDKSKQVAVRADSANYLYLQSVETQYKRSGIKFAATFFF